VKHATHHPLTLPCLLATLLTVSSFPPARAQSITIDNSDAGFSVLSQDWLTGTSAPGHYGADYRFRNTTGASPANTAGQVEWRPTLPAAGTYQVSIYYPQGTNRATNAPFTVHHAEGDTTFLINQQQNGGQWNTLGTFTFSAGTSGSVSLSSDAAASVVIADAVQFTAIGTTVQLTMSASPPAWGTTSPPVGGPYPYTYNTVVSISAAAWPGYTFHHWDVSAGAAPADPAAASTTITLDTDKTVTAVFVEQGATPPEFRAFWADAFHAGFKSTSEIDTLIGWALAGNYNAIIAEVLAFQDTGATGHGAYWNSNIVPKAADISGNIDPLQELVTRAHAAGLEVHCWLVAFRISTTWPIPSNPTVAAHPEWLMVPKASMGTVAKVGSDYVFDPGSPDVQDYLMSIVHELGMNYDLDGIHWDYIRYTQTDAGYPVNTSYAGSTLKRFQTITGYSGTPNATGNTSWNDFRRRTVTEVVRRAMTATGTIPGRTRPLRHSAAVVTWTPASSDFHQTSPYAVFSDWEYWQSQGYLDATVPMSYFDEAAHGTTYRAWVDNSVAWATAAGRQVFIGPGIYMNTFADSCAQMLYARAAGADGLATYSYASTNDGGQPWSDWYAYVADNVFTQPTDPPDMPWRDPTQATQGYVYGRVTNGAGTPLDNVTIRINGVAQVETDGGGQYLVANVPAAAGGTQLTVSALKTGYTEVARPRARVTPSGFTEINLALGPWQVGDYDVDGDVDAADFAQLAPHITGPDNGPPAPGNDLFDVDADNDVDLPDVAAFQRAFGS